MPRSRAGVFSGQMLVCLFIEKPCRIGRTYVYSLPAGVGIVKNAGACGGAKKKIRAASFFFFS
jgi:hypothetical protein